MAISVSDRRVIERTTPVYSARFVDEFGNPVALANLVTVVLTLYNLVDGVIINGRDKQDIKNANDVTIHATTGDIIWSLQEADTVLVNPDQIPVGNLEAHIALFEWSYGPGGARKGKHLVQIDIIQTTKVPT